jgi:hypothetical protein
MWMEARSDRYVSRQGKKAVARSENGKWREWSVPALVRLYRCGTKSRCRRPIWQGQDGNKRDQPIVGMVAVDRRRVGEPIVARSVGNSKQGGGLGPFTAIPTTPPAVQYNRGWKRVLLAARARHSSLVLHRRAIEPHDRIANISLERPRGTLDDPFSHAIFPGSTDDRTHCALWQRARHSFDLSSTIHCPLVLPLYHHDFAEPR